MAINFRDENPRYKPDNILYCELDILERTTEDYFDGTTVS